MTAAQASRDWIGEAKAKDIVVEAERRGAKLRRSGGELVGPCPACGGTDRFSINLRKRLFHCRAAGRGGDVISLVEYLDACDFRAACEALAGRPPPNGEPGAFDEAERRRREEQSAYRAEAQEQVEARYRQRERKRAWEIWQSGRPLADPVAAPVRTYLAGRGLDRLPGRVPLRGSAIVDYWHRGEGAPKPAVIHRGPAMLAAITDDTGRFSGVHCTWIDPTRPGEKAEIHDPVTGELLTGKKVRGSKRRASIKLAAGATAEANEHRPAVRRLVIGEGIETVLSVWLVEAARDQASFAASAYWSAIDLGHLGGRATGTLPHPTQRSEDRSGRSRPLRVPGPVPLADPERDLMPPASVTEILLLADGDSDRFLTEAALRRAASRWAPPSNANPSLLRSIAIAWPPTGTDFNDVLRGAA